MRREVSGTLIDRVLDAAETVVLRHGIATLTLDAVAAEARLSKGGLLHHFPTKDHLIEALVKRCAEHWRAAVLEACEATPPGRARMARALLGCLSDQCSWTEDCRRQSSAVFAALAQNPRLIEPVRAVYAEFRGRLAGDGLPPGVGETVLVCMDGLWLNHVLALAPVDQKRMNEIRRVLESLVATSCERPSHARRKGVRTVQRKRRVTRGSRIARKSR
jgi:AcrR family transcriptional regulator